MNKDEILAKIQDVFRDIFDDETVVLSAETTANDIEGWDSLEHINIISAIEDEFDIDFEMGEITEFKNVGNMIESVYAKLN
mgnify:CR=1 FL=1